VTKSLVLKNVTAASDGYQYKAVLTNRSGAFTTNIVTVNVTGPAVVTQQPSASTAIAGNNATFSAAAKGTGASNIQWQYSSDNGKHYFSVSDATHGLANATGGATPTLTLTGVPATQSGYLFRALFNGSLLTKAALLTVDVLPAGHMLTPAPSVTAGNTATLNFKVDGGSPTPTLQWQLSTDQGNTWGNLAGAKATSLLVKSTTIAQNGYRYRVILTNRDGSVASGVAVLTVTANPADTIPSATAPSNQTINSGQTVTLSLTSIVGSPAPAIQWQVSTDGASTWTVITGATTSKLTLKSVSVAQSGFKYRAVLTNRSGTFTTASVTTTILGKPVISN
jgi:hypothetical protein